MPDVLKISLNKNFTGSKRDSIERYYEHLLDPNFTQSARDIKASILEKAGTLGVCGGLLTAGWMDMERMQERPIIIHIRTDHNRPDRKVKKAQKGKLFAGFAVLQFKQEKSGTYLYIDGLCSNVGKAGVLMDFIINDLGKKLLDIGLIKGFKLSAIGYVIGYYWKKYGFKFYKKKGKKMIEDIKVNTALRDNFSKYVYNANDEYEITNEFTGNWYDKLEQMLGEEEIKNMVSRSVLKKLGNLNKDLGKLRTKNGQSMIDRRETLTKRMHLVREMQGIIKIQDVKIKEYIERGFSPIYEFYLIAREHSAENIHILSRGRKDSSLARQMEEQGISNEGFYMYLVPLEKSKTDSQTKKHSKKSKSKTSKKSKSKKSKSKTRKSKTRKKSI